MKSYWTELKLDPRLIWLADILPVLTLESMELFTPVYTSIWPHRIIPLFLKKTISPFNLKFSKKCIDYIVQFNVQSFQFVIEKLTCSYIPFIFSLDPVKQSQISTVLFTYSLTEKGVLKHFLGSGPEDQICFDCINSSVIWGHSTPQRTRITFTSLKCIFECI